MFFHLISVARGATISGLAAFCLLTYQGAARALTCDGVADATLDLQRAIDASFGGRLELPQGVCVVTATLVVRGGKSLRVSGLSRGASATQAGTVLAWQGSGAGPVMELRGVRDSLFENVAISAQRPVETVVLSTTSRGLTATNNVWRDMHVTGSGNFAKGFAFVAGEGGDNNNDLNSFYNVSVTGYTLAGWSFEHSQSKGHSFYSSQVNGQNWGKYGVTTSLGANGQGGSFVWNGGGGGNNSVADFYLGGPNDIISISGGNFESSSRFLVTAGNSSSAWPVVIQGNRWSGDKLAADGHAVIYTHRGPLTLIGNLLSSGPGHPLDVFLNANGPTQGVAIGNAFISSLINPLTVSYPGAGATWIIVGNTVNTGPATMLPNVLP
jgi:hypothetical protein